MKNKQLLFSIIKKDFEIQTFRAGGKGGQHQNKVETGVRIIHKASGACGEARDSRSQSMNRKSAFNRLVVTQKFQAWLKIEIARKSGEFQLMEQDIEKRVDEQMQPKNLKIEYLQE
jgi:protein subunit release factor B